MFPFIRNIVAAAALLACIADGAYAMSASGYVRTFLTETDNSAMHAGSSLMAESRVRLRLVADPASTLHAEFAYEAAPTIGEHPLDLSAYAAPAYRAGDTSGTLHPSPTGTDDRFIVRQNIDRLNVTWSSSKADITLGRQAVAFGSARTINPTDVIAPYSYTALAKEEAAGVDAMRVRVPLGRFSELDMGAVFGRDFSSDKSLHFIRSRLNVMLTDVTLMLCGMPEQEMFGIDMARAIGGASGWLEFTWNSENITPAGLDAGEYTRLTAGLDYSLENGAYIFAEYHYNGAGASSASRYIANSLNSAYATGGVHLLGRNYLSPGVSYEVSPRLALAAQFLVNLDDSSAMLAPNVQIGLGQDVYTSLGAYAGIGGPPIGLAPESEFGSYPDVYYMSLSYYF